MTEEFDSQGNVHITRDSQGTARDLLHLEEQYESAAGTALLAARKYLEQFGGVLEITESELTNFSLAPETSPIDAGVEYRFEQEKSQFDTTTVVFAQTYFGLPVWEAGVAIHMRQGPFVVLSAQSTRHADITATKPQDRAVTRIEKLAPEKLAEVLGVAPTKAQRSRQKGAAQGAEPDIRRQRLVVYRYDERKRTPPEERPRDEGETLGPPSPRPTLPLPPLGRGVEDGGHYVASELIFSLSWGNIEDLVWRALVDVATLTVLYLEALVDDVTGLVFKEDPVTANGGPLPDAAIAALNPLRTTVLLSDLSPPVAGTYSLTGDRVELQDSELPPIAAPTSPAGTNFDFAARTDNFAAVNAYYHCDRFFQLVEDLGFDLKTYFTGTLFPSVVDHRGTNGPPAGQEINAHCLGNGTFGILRTTFMLADLSNVADPMGLACDWRVVLHELGGHGILYNHVNSPNFNFAHSAGDSFAAVLNDPETRAADRFQTFPWVFSVIDRRHDRDVATGWAWGGVNDFGGYSSEEILCTTHFRLYRSIGGDSTEVAMRTFAARYVAYLMLRTIGSLTQATNPPNAESYAGALMAAELGNWVSEDSVGAVYWKVIRWAFEKQGLFQPPGAPVPVVAEGAPPPVDLYIDDGRHGEYTYMQNFWETGDIWNRLEPDGQPGHQTPIVCKTNYAYVRVRNRGWKVARRARVYAYHCRPSAGLVWPDDFEPMTTASLGVAGSLAPNAAVDVGPFEWTPVEPGHECILMSVTGAGDRANSDPATGLPSATGPTPAWRLVPSDNNIAMRALIPVPGGGGRCALEAAFCNRQFWARNPFGRTARMEVRAELPSFLTTGGWTMQFANSGQGSFTLGPRDSRLIRLRLVSGRDFSSGEVIDAGKAQITCLVLADGLTVGGLTFVLDPALTGPARETRTREEREAQREHEKDCCCPPCIDDRCQDQCRCCEEQKEPHRCSEPGEHMRGPDTKGHEERPCHHEREPGPEQDTGDG